MQENTFHRIKPKALHGIWHLQDSKCLRSPRLHLKVHFEVGSCLGGVGVCLCKSSHTTLGRLKIHCYFLIPWGGNNKMIANIPERNWMHCILWSNPCFSKKWGVHWQHLWAFASFVQERARSGGAPCFCNICLFTNKIAELVECQQSLRSSNTATVPQGQSSSCDFTPPTLVVTSCNWKGDRFVAS